MRHLVSSWLGLFVLGASLLATATSTDERWMQTRNLQLSAVESVEAGKVLVVYVTMEGCPYCAKLEAELLLPALRRNELDDAYFVELSWTHETIVNFEGEHETASSLLQKYGVSVTPTMLFLGPDGEQLVSAVVGYQSEDFYWQYFSAALHNARKTLGRPPPS